MRNVDRTAWRGLALATMMVLGLADGASAATLDGTVAAGGAGLAGYQVALFASATRGNGQIWQRLGIDMTDASGAFHIVYPEPARVPGVAAPVLFVEAERGQVLLAAALGSSAEARVTVNERTTVATANAFAQFVRGSTIGGNPTGMANAVPMAGNLANVETGAVGAVLANLPNGSRTSTLPTFNALSNVALACVTSSAACATLFTATTPAGGARPTNLLQALANLVKSPSFPGYPAPTQDPVFGLSLLTPAHQPALPARPTSWLIFLKITGGFYSTQNSDNLMSGPGNFAIDGRGNVWITDNYMPEPRGHFSCAGRRLIELLPSGATHPGAPFFGGGLSGAGFGITLDPDGLVWVGNFGFQDPPCANLPDAATSDSVSVFTPSGVPLTGPRGFTGGGISFPQGMGADPQGSVWVADCGDDSITRIPHHDRRAAASIPLTPAVPGGRVKPFGLAVGARGEVWASGNDADSLYVLASDGSLVATIPGTVLGRAVLSHPLGLAADSKGNVWAANSDWVSVPCPEQGTRGPAANPSVSLFMADTHQPHPAAPFTGGGLTLPWGVAVDGNDTVWAFNFGAAPIGTLLPPPTGIAHLCGADTTKCPAGQATGDAISPATGYRSDALMRITGGQVDPSGNLWLADNWKIDANPLRSPGGNAVVIAIGAAAPIRTPIIGPPVPFN